MKQCIVLNADYTFLNIVDVQRAFLYISKGKVSVEKYTTEEICTAEDSFLIPKIVRFVEFIHQVYVRRIPWSKRNVMIRDLYTCVYCGKKESKMTIDHVHPRSRGGKNTFENTVCACFACNNKKDDRTPQEAGLYIRNEPSQPTITEFARKYAEHMNVGDIMEELGFNFK